MMVWSCDTQPMDSPIRTYQYKPSQKSKGTTEKNMDGNATKRYGC